LAFRAAAERGFQSKAGAVSIEALSDHFARQLTVANRRAARTTARKGLRNAKKRLETKEEAENASWSREAL
jgi:hypothetical protein